MRLHKNKELFTDAIAITSNHLKLPEIYIEKDYWVTFALHCIFTSSLADCTVFKGGTALSKCFDFIHRFSEDIDLVLLKNAALSANQLKEQLKQISNIVGQFLPEIDSPRITNKKGMIRKTAHAYSKNFEGDFGQVRDLIIIESTWLGSTEPFSKKQISSFIYQMMQAKGQSKIAHEYGLLPFEVSILAPERTLCEKIMSLVRFSYTESPIKDLKNKIRHVYDLHQLLNQPYLNQFFHSGDFDLLLLKVAHDDEISFKNNKSWLTHHPAKAIIFSDIKTIWPELKTTYNGTFKNLIYGELPNEAFVCQTLIKIRERLHLITWDEF